MPVIKPRTRGKHLVRHITRLDRENHETLYAYAQFLSEPTEYVLNQLIELVLAKDKEFLAWRVDHPESQVPPPATPSTRTKRLHAVMDRPHQSPVRQTTVSAPAAG